MAVDPDTEIVTATTVTSGNVADGAVAVELIDDLLHDDETSGPEDDDAPTPTVFGDNAYGTGELQERYEEKGLDSRCKTPAPSAPAGMFGKDRFDIDLEADTVTCPAGVVVAIRRHADCKGARACFGECATCPLKTKCTRRRPRPHHHHRRPRGGPAPGA